VVVAAAAATAAAAAAAASVLVEVGVVRAETAVKVVMAVVQVAIPTALLFRHRRRS